MERQGYGYRVIKDGNTVTEVIIDIGNSDNLNRFPTITEICSLIHLEHQRAYFHDVQVIPSDDGKHISLRTKASKKT